MKNIKAENRVESVKDRNRCQSLLGKWVCDWSRGIQNNFRTALKSFDDYNQEFETDRILWLYVFPQPHWAAWVQGWSRQTVGFKKGCSFVKWMWWRMREAGKLRCWFYNDWSWYLNWLREEERTSMSWVAAESWLEAC